jgi:transposase
MKQISTVGIDLAKSVFEVHGRDASGRAVLRRSLKRAQVLAFFERLPACQVFMEACGTAHYWGREIARFGHAVRLVPPAYVKPYVKRGKNDRIDAQAICEAASRPDMRFVPVKDVEHQALAMLHRSRGLLVKSRTMQVNALRAHLAEFGFVAKRGMAGVDSLSEVIAAAPEDRLPAVVRPVLDGFVAGIAALDRRIAEIEAQLRAWQREDATSRRLDIHPFVRSRRPSLRPDLRLRGAPRASAVKAGRQATAEGGAQRP